MQQQQSTNQYLDQVMEQQVKVDRELRKKKRAPMPQFDGPSGPAPDLNSGAAGRAIDYRITGFWRWKTVVVPPNVYVVHTRRGQEKPLHIGLGQSFSFNPYIDAFLTIPAAMQTIIINANCICIERQGILVQAYVQWIIDDIETAYRKLDFSDPEDPMGIVNVQLREQAEAAIKDKVSTMGIDAVLSDKQPIIEELTHRLRVVAEGRKDESSSGLGLKIVTVQIKEAVVSSTSVWQNLQKPFRAERSKEARFAELSSQQAIDARELANRRERDIAEMQVESDIAQEKAQQEKARFDRELSEKSRRHQLEQEAEKRNIAERNETEVARQEGEMELVKKALALESQRFAAEMEKVRAAIELEEVQAQQTLATAKAELAVEELQYKAQLAQRKNDLEVFKARRAIENNLSDANVRAQLIDKLPEIAEQLPVPEHLRAVSIGSEANGSSAAPLLGFLASALGLVEDSVLANRQPPPPPEGQQT